MRAAERRAGGGLPVPLNNFRDEDSHTYVYPRQLGPRDHADAPQPRDASATTTGGSCAPRSIATRAGARKSA